MNFLNYFSSLYNIFKNRGTHVYYEWYFSDKEITVEARVTCIPMHENVQIRVKINRA